MKNLKRIIAVLTAAVLILALGACGKEQEQVTTETTTAEYTDVPEKTEKTKIISITGGTAIGLVQLKKNRDYSMEVTFVDDPQKAYDTIKSGEADIAGLTLDQAAKLYNETDGGIKILSVSAEVSLYLCSKTTELKGISDLRGKTVVTAGEGTYYQYFLENLLSEGGIEPGKDVEIQYLSSYSDAATKAMGDDAPEYCILPAHFAFQIVDTSDEPAEGKYISAVNLSKTWKKISDMTAACECIVARTEYIDAHPEYISEFMNYEEMSVSFITTNGKTGEYLVDASIFLDAETATGAIGYCGVVFIEGEEMQQLVSENFSFLNGISPDILGGSIPDDGIYYM